MIGIEKQGSVVRVARLTPAPIPSAKPSKRGKIVGFSRKSRRRLVDLFARMNLSGVRKTFITLTFHRWYPPDVVKAAFKRFVSRLVYHYPRVSGIWKIEPQERQVMHYHLLLFRLPWVDQKKLQEVWTECTGEELSIADIRLVKSARAAMSYVSKYIAKTLDAFDSTSFINAPYSQEFLDGWRGRYWGYIQEHYIPFAPRKVAIAVDEQIADYFLWFASSIVTRRNGEKRQSNRIYSQDAERMFRFMLEHGAADVSHCWRPMLQAKELSPATRTKASKFFGAINTHH